MAEKNFAFMEFEYSSSKRISGFNESFITHPLTKTFMRIKLSIQHRLHKK